jgi:hypothetical protein
VATINRDDFGPHQGPVSMDVQLYANTLSANINNLNGKTIYIVLVPYQGNFYNTADDRILRIYPPSGTGLTGASTLTVTSGSHTEGITIAPNGIRVYFNNTHYFEIVNDGTRMRSVLKNGSSTNLFSVTESLLSNS